MTPSSSTEVMDHEDERSSLTPAIPEPEPSPLASVAPTPQGWFNASPLLISLRPVERVNTAKQAGLKNLEVLPLYDLTVDLDPLAGTYDLLQETYVTNQETDALDTLVFRIHGNPNTTATQSPARIKLLRGECFDQSCQVTQDPPSVVTVSFDQPLQPGSRVRVAFELSGILDQVDPANIGLLAQSIAGILSMGSSPKDASYGLMSTCNGFVSMANFFPVLAKREGRRWEQPEKNAIGDFGSDDLAHVRAVILTPALTGIATPGSIVRSVLVPGVEGQEPRRRFDVAASMVRGFALFAGENTETVERRVGEVLIRSTFLQGNRDKGARVADVAEHAMRIFERRFGPYPYAELDVVEAPLTGGAGGLEFSGLISVASMLYRPFRKDDSLGSLLGALDSSLGPAAGMLDDTLEFTTAHEVAHQWWHALVGNDSRAHPFVDESLAQYSTLLYLEDRYGRQHADRVAETQVRLNYVGMRLMGKPDGPVNRPASSFDPLSYAGLVYGKGPLFFREARKVMGDTSFFAALRAYADAHRFRTASAEGPLPFLATGQHEAAVRSLARRWLEESHGDRDLGPIKMDSMLKTLLGPDAASMAPQLEELLRILAPSVPQSPGAGSPAGTSPKDPTQVLKQLEQMLDSF